MNETNEHQREDNGNDHLGSNIERLSGCWRGMRDDGRIKYEMELELRFANQRIFGEGFDGFDQFRVFGHYAGRSSWIAAVSAEGVLVFQGSWFDSNSDHPHPTIVGRWHLDGGTGSGRFEFKAGLE